MFEPVEFCVLVASEGKITWSHEPADWSFRAQISLAMKLFFNSPSRLVVITFQSYCLIFQPIWKPSVMMVWVAQRLSMNSAKWVMAVTYSSWWRTDPIHWT
jgi:hypothetical protein